MLKLGVNLLDRMYFMNDDKSPKNIIVNGDEILFDFLNLRIDFDLIKRSRELKQV